MASMGSVVLAPSTRPPSYESCGTGAVAVCVTFAVLSAVCVAARLGTRRVLVRNVGLDDWAILVSWVFAAAFASLVVIQVHYGLGQHSWMLTLEQYTQIMKPFYASIIFYQASLSVTKVSILLQYLRVFAVGTRTRQAYWVVLGIISVYGIWSVGSAVFMCMPITYFWDKTIDSGRCLPEQGVWFSNAALNIVTDILILILPMHVLSSLQLPAKQKLVLKAIFALGGFVCITSVIRLHALYIISISADISWDNVPIAQWTAVESNIAIICACLPTLRPLLLRIFPTLGHTASYQLDIRIQDSKGAGAESRHVSTFRRDTLHVSRLASVRGGDDEWEKEAVGEKLREVEEGRIKVVTVMRMEVENRGGEMGGDGADGDGDEDRDEEEGCGSVSEECNL